MGEKLICGECDQDITPEQEVRSVLCWCNGEEHQVHDTCINVHLGSN